MTITAAQFRVDYPEFANTTKFPDPTVNYWLAVAYQMLNATQWGSMLDTGAELYVAHNVSLEAQASADAAAGGIPGLQIGPVSAKSVGGVSKGYDTGSSAITDGGAYNATMYGRRLLGFIQIFGAGGIQL